MSLNTRWRMKRCTMVYLLCVAIGILLLVVQFGAIIGFMAEKVYPNLAQPEEIEAPVTFTTYPSSAATEAILGGQAQGLNCSIPFFVNRLAFKQSDGESDISLRFRQACVMHDLCYRHGYATYGYTQADCDTQLQQSSYRLCRQQQEPKSSPLTDVRTMYQSCEKEAKIILLGVSLAGAGPFQDRSRSTYFEYDPMPVDADEYVVGRALPEGPASVNDLSADYGINSFHFKRNLVEMRRLGTASLRQEVYVPVPEARLATPPLLTRLSDSGESGTLGSLVSLARDNHGDTSLEAVLFEWNLKNKPNQLSLSPCTGNCLSETDASVRKFAVVDGKQVMISLTHRGTPNTVKIVQEEFPKLASSLMTDYSLNGGAENISFRYRFLSHDMLLEKDASGQATWAWVFARGMPLKNKDTFSRDMRGTDYDKYVTVVRQRLGNGHEHDVQRFRLNVDEKDEPLSLVRVDNEGNNILVGLTLTTQDWNCVENGKPVQQPPQLKLWRVADGPDPIPLTLPLQMTTDMTILTPLIVRLSSLQFPLMIIPQVENDRWQHVETQKQAREGRFKVDFTITGLKLTPDNQLGFDFTTRLHCELNLNHQLQKAKVIRERAYRILFGTSGPDYKDKESNKEILPEEISAIKSDLAQRWRMSQVIASEREMVTDKGTTEKLLAITMVFNGFPGMSFQLLLNMGPDGIHYLKTNNEPECYLDKV